jgi:hypothetical protein
MTTETRSKIGFSITVLSGIISITVGVLTIHHYFVSRHGGKE